MATSDGVPDETESRVLPELGGYLQHDVAHDLATDAPLSVTESVAGMGEVIDHLDLGQTCTFLHYDGSVLPW
jgi:hypothetical protein